MKPKEETRRLRRALQERFPATTFRVRTFEGILQNGALVWRIGGDRVDHVKYLADYTTSLDFIKCMT